MLTPTIQIELPAWLKEILVTNNLVFPTPEDQMRFVISLAQKNIHFATGGPFAAAIFDIGTGRLISAGVNMVTTLGLSIAHAEIISIMQAQAILGNFDLGSVSLPGCVLVSSTECCAMCLGAVPWSGVRALVTGAKDEDARAVGFDEGSKREDWISELEKRGISVLTEVLRADAAQVLQDYKRQGGKVYNSVVAIKRSPPSG